MTFEYEFVAPFHNPLTIVSLVLVAMSILSIVISAKKDSAVGAFVSLLFIFVAFAPGSLGASAKNADQREAFFKKLESTYGVQLDQASQEAFFEGNKVDPIVATPIPVLLAVEWKTYSTTIILREVDDNEWVALSPKDGLTEVVPLDEAVDAGLTLIEPLND